MEGAEAQSTSKKPSTTLPSAQKVLKTRTEPLYEFFVNERPQKDCHGLSPDGCPKSSKGFCRLRNQQQTFPMIGEILDCDKVEY